MSLFITAFSKARFVHQCGPCDDENHHYVCSPPSLTERLDGEKIGCYVSDKGEKFSFEAGYYGGYNLWRELLSHFALNESPETVWGNPHKFAGKPFVELINMADDEGAIGPVTSKKLAADFERMRDRVKQKLCAGIDKYLQYRDQHITACAWLKLYDAWHKAFQIASDDGFVIFI